MAIVDATSSSKCLNNSSTISIGRNNEELKLNLRSNKKKYSTSPQKDINQSTSRNSMLPKTKLIDLQPRGLVEESGYDMLECAVKREDKTLLAVLQLYLVAVALTVILWSFSVIPITYAIFIVTGLVLMAYVHSWNTIVEENLLVTSTVGIQVQQMNILGKLKYAKYVPIENIKAVVINEIIRRQRVISYLLIILEGTESTGKIMVPLLTGTLPRLRTIEQIYQHVQKVIF